MVHHPDICQGDKKVAAQRFARIVEAHDVLSDPVERRRYDADRRIRETASSPSSRPATVTASEWAYRTPPPVEHETTTAPRKKGKRSGLRLKRVLVLGASLAIALCLCVVLASAIGEHLLASREKENKVAKGPARRQDETAKALGVQKEITLALGSKVKMRLVLIPAGKFMMGTPANEKDRSGDEAQHEVTITNPFYVGVYHVTKGQFAAFVADTNYMTDAEKDGKAWSWDGTKFREMPGNSWRKTGFQQDDDHPVVNVSWNDAVAFCNWLGERSGKAVKLPTEAQFEFANRAGSKATYPWGDDPDDGKGWCNAADQTAKKQSSGWNVFNWDDGYTFTSPVGKFKANAFGLYDMTGNAWEWCADWYDNDYYANSPKTDPPGPATGQFRVLRGGSCGTDPWFCRSAYRSGNGPVYRNIIIGFRVVALPGSD